LYVASAVAGECEYFITTDQELIKKLKDYKKIKVINPTELIITKGK